jgi:hypothetical protein
LSYSFPEIYSSKTFSGLLSLQTIIVNVATLDFKNHLSIEVAENQSEFEQCILGCNASREG